MMTLRHKIPLVYHGFFNDLLDLEIPEEKIATCNNCTLCQSSQSPYIHTKCCTYYPHLPNFLLGGLLQDSHPSLQEGKRRVRQIIERRIGVSPYGIIPSARYNARNEEIRQKEFWEASPEENKELLCPYYDLGNCSIWKYRENCCVTHFCTSVGGRKGYAFWAKLNAYLLQAEQMLAKYAMLRLGWPPEQILLNHQVKAENLMIDDAKGSFDEQQYNRIWWQWQGKEEEFYLECYRLVAALDRPEFERLMGLSFDILEKQVRKAHGEFLPAIYPDYLVLNPGTEVIKKDEKTVILKTESGELEVPAIIYSVIRSFNGKRSTAEICHTAYKIMIKMEGFLDKLIACNVLLPAKAQNELP